MQPFANLSFECFEGRKRFVSNETTYRPAPKPRKLVSNILFCSSTLSTKVVMATMLNTSTYASGDWCHCQKLDADVYYDVLNIGGMTINGIVVLLGHG